ncbi:MAG: protocatechuate 3,4-dioxygenase subunit alpha [Solirubrobacteraceae bacterium]
MTPGETPSQTVGPFFAIGLPWEAGRFAVPAGTPGAIHITGEVQDGDGEPVPDCLVETWQVLPDGYRGFSRSDGGLDVVTLKTAYVDVSVCARGMLDRVVTRIYFADEPEVNAADPVFAAIPAERRDTLLAQRTDDGYRFDIRLQGPGETVFFAL